MRDNNPLPTVRQDVGEAAAISNKYFYAAGKKFKSSQTA
jgi:hypothetical protein